LHREGDRVALALKTREVAARCMLRYAEPYRREPPFPRRAGDALRADPQATAEEAELPSFHIYEIYEIQEISEEISEESAPPPECFGPPRRHG